MSERPVHGAPSPHGALEGNGPTDAELNARGIVGFGIGLGILIAAVLGAVWLLSAGLKSVAVTHDPAPSPLAEANAHRLPPEPRLQTTPNEDMKALRAREDADLTGYSPADRATNTARIPIDRAIEILAQTGLPEVSPPPASAKQKGSATAASSAVSAPKSSASYRGEGKPRR